MGRGEAPARRRAPGRVPMEVDAAAKPALEALFQALNERSALAAEVEAAERKAGWDPNP